MRKLFPLFLVVLLFSFAVDIAAQPQYYNINTGTSSNAFPFATAGGKAVNSLILAGEFNQPAPLPPGQQITKVYFRMATAGSRVFTNLHILMAQDVITALTTGTFYPGPYDTVFVADTTLSSTVDGWMQIELEHPFPYDPTKSLILFVGHCGAVGTGMNVRNTSLTPAVRRVWSVGGCPFAPYSSMDGATINFGVDVEPAAANYPVPELIYYKFEDNPSGTLTTNYASAPVGTNNPSIITGHTIGTGGLVDSCLIGAAGTGANCVLPGWNWNVTGNWTIGFWVSNLGETSTGSPTYLFGDPGTTSFRCFYGGAALPNNIYLRGPFNTSGHLISCPMPGSYYFHFVWDGTAIKIYRDGVLLNSYTEPNVMPTGTGFKVAGYSTSSYALNAGGKLDEFRLYNRALDTAEIAATWNIELGGTPTGITPVKNKVPDNYLLSQNYPNPFNPVTKISFAIPKSGFVTLKVYDVIGREVATLVNADKNAGSYIVDFDATNLTSGIYFYRLDINGFVDTKKMMVLK